MYVAFADVVIGVASAAVVNMGLKQPAFTQLELYTAMNHQALHIKW